ncbi:MAG TPA: ABC transporter permease [Pyrinomonadaceae bacterium]|nr:ABC transporter permease [Pyrinomonadaceae bacterium]
MQPVSDSLNVSQPLNVKGESSNSLRWWLNDVTLMAQRNVRRMLRSPDLVFYAVLQPVVFILLFVYVFGGAMQQIPNMNYKQFLFPGIFVQTVVFGSVAATAIGVALDMQRGIMDRFLSLPISSSSVLMGRQFSEILRNVLLIVVLVVVSLIVGFRFQGSLPNVLLGMGLLLFFGFAFSWVAALIGLASGSAEAAQSAGIMWLFPFTFVSSAFVPTSTMPGWLQVYAQHSPITSMVDTLRILFNGQPATSAIWISLAWSLGITAVFMPLSIARFRRGKA